MASDMCGKTGVRHRPICVKGDIDVAAGCLHVARCRRTTESSQARAAVTRSIVHCDIVEVVLSVKRAEMNVRVPAGAGATPVAVLVVAVPE